MRIIAGQHRGVTLAQVGKGDTAAHLRPTSDRVREALFNVLQGGRFGDVVSGARVLDLFAGTGALGLEALSRGATHATFVDSGAVAQSLIRGNLTKLGETADVLAIPVVDLPATDQPCDLIFLDPPYGQKLGLPALQAAARQGWIAPGAVIVWEESTPQIAPRGYTRLDQRQYGDTWITYLRTKS